jgi:hypothetical protein
VDIDRYAKLRPYLYHLTDNSNLDRIREEKMLSCAAKLMRRAGRTDLLRTRRLNHEPIEVDGSLVSLRDQKPLLSKHMDMTGGFKFEDFVGLLNTMVFFWPGDDEGPIRSGESHFAHYAAECPAILRCRFQSLISANSSAVPLFCPYNSGAPRTVNGRKSPRGRDTFLKAFDFPRTPSADVEVTFKEKAALPPDVEVGYSLQRSWRPFF